jgi:hypothetical protein
MSLVQHNLHHTNAGSQTIFTLLSAKQSKQATQQSNFPCMYKVSHSCMLHSQPLDWPQTSGFPSVPIIIANQKSLLAVNSFVHPV